MSNTHDFNDAGTQRSFDVIPTNTVATLQVKVRAGGAGDDGWLKRSKAGDSEALDLEFRVVDGPYTKRKFWVLFTLAGTSEGHAEAGKISRERLRAILESARGIRPDDTSDVATQARRIAHFGELDGLCFIGRIGVEPATGNFKAKNTLDEVITPERAGWHRIEQSAKPAPPAPITVAAKTDTTAKIERPAWAS
jgi:hypothetical protein